MSQGRPSARAACLPAGLNTGVVCRGAELLPHSSDSSEPWESRCVASLTCSDQRSSTYCIGSLRETEVMGAMHVSRMQCILRNSLQRSPAKGTLRSRHSDSRSFTGLAHTYPAQLGMVAGQGLFPRGSCPSATCPNILACTRACTHAHTHTECSLHML